MVNRFSDVDLLIPLKSCKALWMYTNNFCSLYLPAASLLKAIARFNGAWGDMTQANLDHICMPAGAMPCTTEHDLDNILPSVRIAKVLFTGTHIRGLQQLLSPPSHPMAAS